MDLASPPSYRPTLYGSRHMVVSGHPLATMAATKVLEGGGNAIDAGVAAGFALNVVQCDMANLGGIAPILLFQAQTRKVTTFAGVGRWPRAATLERVRADGNGRIPVSPKRWVVPAAVDAWLGALAGYGTWTATDVLQPAIELAERGFPANYFIRHNLVHSAPEMASWTRTQEVFYPDGRPPEIGERIVQPHLAATLRMLADAERSRGGSRVEGIASAREAFYRGEIAERIGAFAREVGAYLTVEDLHAHTTAEDTPVSTTYRGSTVYSCRPWSQGPAVLQMLNVLEGYDLGSMASEDAAHVQIEAAKMALLDRNAYYGDPDFVDVPLGWLVSKEHGAELRERIDGTSAREPALTGAARGTGSPDTTYVCVVDAAGNAFSAVPSDSTILVTPMVPGLGFGISDRGLQASLDPANPNYIQAGKRPRITPNPGLVVGDGFVMPYGSPGGDVQTQAMQQFLVNALDRGMELQAAVEAPRWTSYSVPLTEDPHPAQPGLVRLEGRCSPEMARALETRGHRIEWWPDLSALAGGVCAIKHDVRSGVLAGAADPRRMAYGIGW